MEKIQKLIFPFCFFLVIFFTKKMTSEQKSDNQDREFTFFQKSLSDSFFQKTIHFNSKDFFQKNLH